MAAAIWACGDGPAGPARNVILVSIDTLRADHLGCYGYPAPTSPTVDRLAADGVLFESAVSHAPSTLLAHSALLSSRIPQLTAVSHLHRRPLGSQFDTLAEVLQEAGFRTAAFHSGGQLAAEFGLGQGFETYTTVTPREPENHRFEQVVEAGLEWLDTTSRDGRFFLFLHTYEVHHPYLPDARWLEAFDAGYDGPIPDRISIDLLREINHGRRKATADDLRHIVAAYDAGIRSMDEALSHLLAALEDRDLLDDSLFVFTSDHGEEFGERGAVGWHALTLFQEMLSVPLILRLPGGAHAGTRIEHLARHIDVAPTVLAAVGVPAPAGFTGRSLLPLLAGEPPRPRPAVAFRDTETTEHSALILRNWKLAEGRLYDLRTDAGELRDLAASQPRVAAAMTELLTAHAERTTAPPTEPVPLSAETMRQLRSLGYLDD